jgi:hypothetical protein
MSRLSRRGRGLYQNRGRISIGFIDTDTDPDPDADGPLPIIRIAAFCQHLLTFPSASAIVPL